MNTLVSQINIVGAIRGRRINISHVYTVEDVMGAGIQSPDVPTSTNNAYTGGGVYGGGYVPQLDVPSPDYLMMSNKSTSRDANIDINNDDESISVSVALPALSFMVIPKAQAGGVFNYQASNSITSLLGIDSIEVGVDSDRVTPVVEVLAAQNQAS